ncbi:MAG: DUF1573 domain-containing protein [Chitinophagales bacterium]|nr:DUF1573 domain-containing protein [Chitinophagales bacterium]
MHYGSHDHDHVHEAAKEVNNAKQNPFEQQKDPMAGTQEVGPTTTMNFDKMEHDFGTIEQGDKVAHTFEFTNTGSEPLIIQSAKGSCGCTVPQWPKDPVAPGEVGELKVEYDSKGKRNQEVKTVTIMANTEPAITRLTIKAYVNAPEADATMTIEQ